MATGTGGTLAGRRARARARRASRAPSVTTFRKDQQRLAAMFVLPPLLLYAVFMIYPFFGSIYYSLTEWDGASGAKEWVGLGNYIEALGDSRMWESLEHNAIWAVLGTIAPIVIGFVLAVLLWENSRFILFFRTLFFIPFILPTVVSATVWQWIYNPVNGVLNSGLETFGLESLTKAWLGDPDTALIAVLAVAIWGTVGFVVVVLLAGLQNLDMSQVDAAKIDGANWRQRAWYVILPGIAPVLTMVTAVTLIGAFSVFDIVFIMTQGGPGISSELLGTYTYNQAFEQNRVGYGAALSMIMTLLTLVTAVVFIRLRERRYAND
ncbi:MAG TPA: sugar ABC transporter permease [Solirubrobacteraceae bacterium]|nr:sugar ABC transporter permease [Solirubrobacteraceae bacterium]